MQDVCTKQRRFVSVPRGVRHTHRIHVRSYTLRSLEIALYIHQSIKQVNRAMSCRMCDRGARATAPRLPTPASHPTDAPHLHPYGTLTSEHHRPSALHACPRIKLRAEFTHGNSLDSSDLADHSTARVRYPHPSIHLPSALPIPSLRLIRT